ncbi:MAG: type IIA DNA topoisomerase subunit B [Verrucomicrobiales bacterium]|nr:type IIA DNA topoisomerase subunit B [Verrucomicrobiales bacterium]
MSNDPHAYNEDSIKTLDPVEHIRMRPTMYIGKLGDGSSADDGLYILVKEAIDNSIDEFVMGYGKQIEVELDDRTLTVRDYGRGIPLGKVYECAAIINTGGKYDSKAFQKSVGLNGVGLKAVNALSTFFEIQAFRDGQTMAHEFARGKATLQMKKPDRTTEPNGTRVSFTPEGAPRLFDPKFKFDKDILSRMFRYYSYLNTGLTINFNGQAFRSKNGLADLLVENLAEDPLYPIVHLKGPDIEIAFTHTHQTGEDIFSFVNGQWTTQGGTHLAAFREALVKVAREFYKKDFEPADVRQGIVGAISLRVQEPQFETQTKIKLTGQEMEPGGASVRSFVSNFLAKELDPFLHRNKLVAEAWQGKISDNEKERKELAGVAKLARERAKKAKIHNRKLRDCRVHYDGTAKNKELSTIFIAEGDSAGGTITSARDPNFQAVFNLRGKPLNTFGLTKKVVYENEEFNLLQHALNIEDSLDDLRYNRVVLATDADVDGMHIRLLMITFFLQFFPDLVRQGHLFVLQTPLFRVRNKKETHYCYTEEEKQDALKQCGKSAEITRFKGLGEMSTADFKDLIGPEMQLEPVTVEHHHSLKDLLTFYMGKNTPERQEFIIGNLRIEQDLVEETKEPDSGEAA